MQTVWEKEYHLRGSDFDTFSRIAPSAVMDLFQDAASCHAEELGVGFEEMLQKGRLWVLTRVKFEICAKTEPYGTVRVRTWPLKPNRFNYRREYCVEDLDGNPLIKGSSDWVVIDCAARKMVSAPDLYPFTEGFCEETMFEERLRKVGDFAQSGTPYRMRTAFCDLDRNGHVNNTKYAKFIMNALSPEKDAVLKEFQIDYRKEVVSGEELQIYCTADEGQTLAKGLNAAGEVMFAAKMIFE